MAALTAESRISRLRDHLAAKSVPQDTEDLKPGSNLLLAATIHGLARRGKGHKLTEVEQMGVTFFEDMADREEEELQQYSQICSEAKKAARARQFNAINAPISVMELPDDTPFTRDMFDEEVKKLCKETVLQPHIRSAPPDYNPDEGIPESPEYIAAKQKLGRGVTMYIANTKSDDNARSDRDKLKFKWYPTWFKCIKESGEVGKDEIYFTWGFGSDGGNKNSHRTAEFGSVSTGTSREFPNYPPIFDGTVQNCFAGNIICWEADHSNSEWYRKLGEAMGHLAELAKTLSHDVGSKPINELIGQIPGFSAYAELTFWIENVATLIKNFLSIFQNKDDKVSEESFGFGREDLDRYGNVGDLARFDGGGGGHFQVTVYRLKG